MGKLGISPVSLSFLAESVCARRALDPQLLRIPRTASRAVPRVRSALHANLGALYQDARAKARKTAQFQEIRLTNFVRTSPPATGCAFNAPIKMVGRFARRLNGYFNYVLNTLRGCAWLTAPLVANWTGCHAKTLNVCLIRKTADIVSDLAL